MHTKGRSVVVAGAVLAALGAFAGTGGAEEAGAPESIPAAPLRLAVTHAGRTDGVAASGAIRGGGLRFAYSPLDLGQDRFATDMLRRQEWTPVDLSLQLATAGDHSFAVDAFPSAATVSGVTVAVSTIESSGSTPTTLTLRPGQTTYGEVVFVTGIADRPAIKAWFAAAAAGDDATRKELKIDLRAGGTVVRTIALHAARPLSWTPVDARTDSIVVLPQSIEVSGTGAAAPLLTWLGDTLTGKDWRANVTWQSGKRQLTFADSFVTRYALVENASGELRESWRLQPAAVGGLL